MNDETLKSTGFHAFMLLCNYATIWSWCQLNTRINIINNMCIEDCQFCVMQATVPRSHRGSPEVHPITADVPMRNKEVTELG